MRVTTRPGPGGSHALARSRPDPTLEGRSSGKQSGGRTGSPVPGLWGAEPAARSRPGAGSGPGGGAAGRGGAGRAAGRGAGAGPLTRLAPPAARGRAAPRGSLRRAGGGRADPVPARTGQRLLRHFLPARRLPEGTRGRIFPLTHPPAPPHGARPRRPQRQPPRPALEARECGPAPSRRSPGQPPAAPGLGGLRPAAPAWSPASGRGAGQGEGQGLPKPWRRPGVRGGGRVPWPTCQGRDSAWKHEDLPPPPSVRDVGVGLLFRIDLGESTCSPNWLCAFPVIVSDSLSS